MKVRTDTGRRFADSLAKAASVLFASTGLLALVWILATVILRGYSALNPDFFLKPTAPPGSVPAGMANAILGTFLITVVSAIIAVPIGVLAGVYLSEFAADTRFGNTVRFAVNMLISVPSIIAGLFVWGLVVSTTGGFSGWAGALSLALIMLPVVARTTADILKMVPDSLRESAMAIGAPRWYVMGMIFLAAKNGLVTGILLAIARVSGETAPLLFTALNSPYWPSSLSQPTANLPVTIFNYAMSPYHDWQAMAWGASLVITTAVLAVSVIVRTVFNTKQELM